jgi:hypothetical protein
MVYRDGGQGTFVLDLRLGKLGRLKRASGTSDLVIFRDVRTTLVRLRRERRWDLLALVVNRLVTPLGLCEAIWGGRQDELPTGAEAQPLRQVVDRWIAGLDRAPVTRREYERMLLRVATERARLADVPLILARERALAMRTGKRAAFNRLYAALRTLLRHVVGPDHRLLREVQRVEWLRESPRQGNPQSVDAVRSLAGKLGRHAPTLWALCLTGMRRGEYFGRRFTVLPDRIAIRGTKTRAAAREVPRPYPVESPTCEYRWFKGLLSEASGGAVRVHDLRYTYQRWLEEAGVPEVRIKCYAGHAVRDVSELYRRGRGFAEHLAGDAEKLRAWFGSPPPRQALEVVS